MTVDDFKGWDMAENSNFAFRKERALVFFQLASAPKARRGRKRVENA